MSLLTFSDENGVGKGLSDENPPFYTSLEYVEVYDYNQDTSQFNLRFRDEFDYIDS